jgi:hypothetical protein
VSLGRVVCPVVCLLALVVSDASAAAPGGPFATAVYDPASFSAQRAPAAFRRVSQAGATYVRLSLVWYNVAPNARTKPVGFNAANPLDPHYRWGAFDRQVKTAVAAGLQPIVSVYGAPLWAEPPDASSPGGVKPDPTEYRLFARAAAARYNGRHAGLPRVRYWQAWNEPNISLFLVPQFEDDKPFSPAWYRKMVNAFADGVYAARSDNRVIAGGTAPFRDITENVVAVDKDWGPLSFMRELLCLSPSLKPTCSDPIRFDIWGHDPYTSGGPTHHAVLPNDVSLGDLPAMRRVLNAGIKTGHVISRAPVQFWALEFSWDTKAPDPKGVPMTLATRWVAEALYRMWLNGVSVVTWFQLRDQPAATSFYQSGLYFNRGTDLRNDRPKPILQAFRFPFVAFPSRGRVLVWGRTPSGKPAKVLVEQKSAGSGWRKLGLVQTNQYGIFQQRLAGAATGSVRARIVGPHAAAAVPFSLARVPDRFFNPFGQATLLEPKSRK